MTTQNKSSFLFSSSSALITPTVRRSGFRIAKGDNKKMVDLKGQSTKNGSYLVHRVHTQVTPDGRVMRKNNMMKVQPKNLKNLVAHSLMNSPVKKSAVASENKIKKINLTKKISAKKPDAKKPDAKKTGMK